MNMHIEPLNRAKFWENQEKVLFSVKREIKAPIMVWWHGGDWDGDRFEDVRVPKHQFS